MFLILSGIVEFLDSGEAKKAFRNLAYSRFKSLPLYLEWAPVQVFKAEFTPKTENMEDEEEADDSKGRVLLGGLNDKINTVAS